MHCGSINIKFGVYSHWDSHRTPHNFGRGPSINMTDIQIEFLFRYAFWVMELTLICSFLGSKLRMAVILGSFSGAISWKTPLPILFKFDMHIIDMMDQMQESYLLKSQSSQSTATAVIFLTFSEHTWKHLHWLFPNLMWNMYNISGSVLNSYS